MLKKILDYIDQLNKKNIKSKSIESVKSITLTKQKKAVIFIGLSIIIIFVLFFLGFNNPQPLPILNNQDSPISVLSQSDDLQHWTVKSGETIDSLKEQIQSQVKNEEETKKKIVELNEVIEKQNQQMATLEQWFNKATKETSDNFAQFRDQVSGELQRQEARTLEMGGSNTSSKISDSSSSVDDNLQVFTPPENDIKKDNSSEMAKNPYRGYLPVGSFFTATLLNGVTAPTGTFGQSNPVPIVMKIMTDAILPNDKYRYQLQGCFVLGSSFGVVSSERVHIDLSQISCIKKDGTAAVIGEIRGFATDSDGIGDLRGKLENRQGSKIGMATLAGFAQGIGQMFGNAQGTSVLTPSGSGISMDTDQKLAAAGFNGVGQAANTVAQFYVKQAEQIYPVIVVQGGRNVTLNITKGVTLHWTNIKDDLIPSEKNTANPPIPTNENDTAK